MCFNYLIKIKNSRFKHERSKIKRLCVHANFSRCFFFIIICQNSVIIFKKSFMVLVPTTQRLNFAKVCTKTY